MAQAPLIPGEFPVGYCYPSSPQVLIEQAFELAHAEVENNATGVAVGPSEPGATFKLWYTNHRLYEWDAGIGRRIALYWEPTGNEDIKMLTEMTEAEIAAYDTGATPALVAGAEQWTGPFWEIDHNYDARIPIGVGTLPLSTTAVTLGGTGGADQINIGILQLPKHRHELTMGPESGLSSYLPPSTLSENGTFKVNGAEQLRFYDLPSTEIGRTRENVNGSTDPDGVDPLNIMPPYRGLYVVKRTARIYYTL